MENIETIILIIFISIGLAYLFAEIFNNLLK